MRLIPVPLTIVLLLILTCGCSESPPAQPTVSPTAVSTTPSTVITTIPTPVITPSRTPSVSDNTITMVKNTFKPAANMTVKVGSTVRWVNADDHPHRIEFADKTFSTSAFLLGASQSFSQRFDRAGTFDYDCTIHPYMQGTITVEA
jgi:plastocyanin